jgi:hypothetical protein
MYPQTKCLLQKFAASGAQGLASSASFIRKMCSATPERFRHGEKEAHFSSNFLTMRYILEAEVKAALATLP